MTRFQGGNLHCLQPAICRFVMILTAIPFPKILVTNLKRIILDKLEQVFYIRESYSVPPCVR
jgi:hypothetical protein